MSFLDTHLADVDAESSSRLAFLAQEVQDIRNNKASFAALERLEAVQAWLRTSPLLRRVDFRGSQLDVTESAESAHSYMFSSEVEKTREFWLTFWLLTVPSLSIMSKSVFTLYIVSKVPLSVLF